MMVVANYDELKERVNKWLFIYLLIYLFIYLFIYDGPQLIIQCSFG